MLNEDILIPAVIFYAIYQTVRIMSEHFLKRKIIKSGHYEKAEILSQVEKESEEVNKYPSLKWGLVAFMAGLGLIVIELLRTTDKFIMTGYDAILPFGIELVFISMGFLAYFFYVNYRSK